MNWNSIYTIYQRLASLVMAICIGWLLFASPPTYHAVLQDLHKATHTSIKNTKSDHSQRMEDLQEDVYKNGNSREGLDRVKRAEALQTNTLKVIETLRQLENDISPPRLLKQQVQQLMRTHTKWIQREFQDLNPTYLPNAIIQPNVLPNQGVTSVLHTPTDLALKAWLAQQQLLLLHYEHNILRALGAFDIYIGGGSCGPYYSYVMFGVAPTKIISVGDTYTADLIWLDDKRITQSKWLKGKMYYNNQRARDGRVPFTPKGTGKQQWEAKFKFRIQGKDTTVVRKVYYDFLPEDK